MSPDLIQSAAPAHPADEISRASDFTRYFINGSKPAFKWTVGPEIELFGFDAETLSRITPERVQAVINGFTKETVSRAIEGGFITEIVLDKKMEGRLTLEPGGQIEYSGANHRSLIDVERGLQRYLRRLSEIGRSNGVIFVAAGFDPIRSIAEQQWIPKRRYEVMRPYLAGRGRRAWDMMCRTAAIQVNLDYGDLEDLANKFMLATRLAPVAAAIFANSPFEQGRLSGYKSTRYRAWLETDPDRTGPSPVALGDGFSIERFVDHVVSVPMFFIRRDGDYIDLAGRSFKEFIADGGDYRPVLQDFTDHLSTIFTEARLKPHIEQRSMDCGQIEMAMAALAFWKGLMYDTQILNQALDLAPRTSRDGYARLQMEVARHGLDAKIEGFSVMRLAQAAIEMSRAGLRSMASEETRYLDIIEQLVIRERSCPADILIRNFRGSWHGDVLKALDQMRIESQISNLKSHISNG
jgi:glutamate--cysteine ligase